MKIKQNIYKYIYKQFGKKQDFSSKNDGDVPKKLREESPESASSNVSLCIMMFFSGDLENPDCKHISFNVF